MKKIHIVLALFFSMNLFASQVVTVSKTMSELASQYDWKHDTCYLSFQLNDVITITGTDGNAKYCSDNTAESMRYYQDCKKGEFAIKAGAGATIQSIKLTYIQQKTNSVVCTNWGADGKSIAANYQVKNNEVFVVNAEQITLYVGRTDANTGGQVRITAMEVSYTSASGDQILSVTTQELANQYGWGHETTLRNFDLNDVLSVDVDSAGTMKYNMNTKQFHCYQWLGGFTIRAKEGCTIKTVKLTYFSVNSGVMTMNWGVDGKNIPVTDRIASNQVVEVNGSSVKFFVGTTGSNTDGQIRIEKWEIEYNRPKTSEVMMRTTWDLGMQNGWSDETCPVNIPFNNAISFHSDKDNNVKYYSTTKSFHCYQWCGGFYFKARPGSLIKSVTLTYDAINDGVLIQNWITGGKNIPEDYWITSGTAVTVNGDSVHFFTGNKKETNNCQIHITGFSIVYVDTLAQVESFSSCDLEASATPVVVLGDKGIYKWKLSNFQRTSADVIYTNQGTRLSYQGAIASDDELEGGVKDVSFEWRTAKDNSPIHFTVNAGSWTDDYKHSSFDANSHVINYTRQVEMKQNCTFSIWVGSQESPAQLQPVIGPITITPYLLFKVPNHIDSIDTNLSAYDLKPLLINNSDELPVFEVISNTTGDTVTIKKGVVDLTSIQKAGDVKVKASCFGGNVSTTLTLHIDLAPRVYFDEPNVVVDWGAAPFVNRLHVPDSVGAITYSSSNDKVAMVNDSGLITIVGIGQTIITAHVGASEKYIATSTSYNLSVVYTPAVGSYRIETFSQCRKKKATEGFAYVEGDDAVYDWNLSNFSRDKADIIDDEQGIMLYYGGSIASNGEQEGGVKYLSFPWRSVDPISPISFVINVANTSVSYSQSAVGDASMAMTYSCLFNQKSNTAFSINLRAKENPAQSRIVVGPILIMPYVLFANKYVELELPQTQYDCTTDLIDNTDGVGEIVYSIVSSTTDSVRMEGSVLDLSAATKSGDVYLKAQWGDVSTTMTVHLTVPTGLIDRFTDSPIHRFTKIVKDNQLLIYHNGQWWTVLGKEIRNEK